MSSVIFFAFFLALSGASNANMPAELRKFLAMGEKSEETKAPVNEELQNEPGTFIGSNFDINRFLSQSPAKMASVENARRKLGAGDVAQYISAPVETVECHVEFQVTERVPGRCTKLAGNIPACQSQKYVGINYSECS